MPSMVAIKMVAVLFFIAVGARYVRAGNWAPFMPYGWSGVMAAAAVVFFAYIGFDAVSTTAEEAKNPQRDLPIGIIASLVICTALYLAVAAVLTGIVPVTQYRSIADALPGVSVGDPDRGDAVPQRSGCLRADASSARTGRRISSRREPSQASPACCSSCF